MSIFIQFLYYIQWVVAVQRPFVLYRKSSLLICRFGPNKFSISKPENQVVGVSIGDKTVQEKADKHKSKRERKKAGMAIYERPIREQGLAGMGALEECVHAYQSELWGGEGEGNAQSDGAGQQGEAASLCGYVRGAVCEQRDAVMPL